MQTRTEPPWHPADDGLLRSRPQQHGRAVSGAITTVTSRTGTPVAVLRADYDVPSPHGDWTIHGYAWRCPTCPRLALEYRPEQGFGQALADAHDHECEAHHG